jgi:hypothetical protein
MDGVDRGASRFGRGDRDRLNASPCRKRRNAAHVPFAAFGSQLSSWFIRIHDYAYYHEFLCPNSLQNGPSEGKGLKDVAATREDEAGCLQLAH